MLDCQYVVKCQITANIYQCSIVSSVLRGDTEVNVNAALSMFHGDTVVSLYNALSIFYGDIEVCVKSLSTCISVLWCHQCSMVTLR